MGDHKISATDKNEYKVEAVVDKTIEFSGGSERVYYMIKWLGYGHECNTWEPMENLYCEDLISIFEQKLAKKKQGKDKGNKELPNPWTKVGEKRKFSTDKSLSSGEVPSENKSRKKEPTTTESLSSSTAIKKNERNKSVDFRHTLAQKSEAFYQSVSERKDKRHYKRRSDAGPQIDPELDPEKIVGAADSGGELMFLIKWKGKQKVDLVPAREANVRFTDLVVKFYEDRIQWHAGHLLASGSSE